MLRDVGTPVASDDGDESGDEQFAGTNVTIDATMVPHLADGLDKDRRPPIGWNPTRRPPRHPVKPVPKRLLEDPSIDRSIDPARWTLVSIRAADDLGHVRTSMNYSQSFGTSAGFFAKTHRTQFLDGPNEPAVADRLEMSTTCLNFQMQPIDMTFRRDDGRLIHKYPDICIEFEDNSVRFGEIKSDETWFDAPAIKRPLDRIDLALGSIGIPRLLRIKGMPYRQEDALAAHAIAMNARLTPVNPAEAAAVRAMITASGGCARYADAVAVIGAVRADAVDKLYAMLMRRVVSFSLTREPHGATPVTAPRPAEAFALRALLSKFVEKVAA
ncbi:hypothetical protein [uncultured Sphingomonas sp.]|uniref:hypothetical protein n=1 Tax=uncultured Sphingomonas sp. TaxID=158754 RepID=UPI001576038E